MRYDIVSIIIAAVIAILLLVFNASLSKDDKYFMSAIIVILILTGLYFSIKDTNIKNKDSETQSVKLDTTITNTRILKEKSDSIIAELNQNLDRVVKINDDLKGFNGQLQLIEKEVEEQIGMLRSTLNQTKIFEEKVSEQLALEKKRFELERPEVEVVAKLEKRNDLDGSHYRVSFLFRNLGKRIAKNFGSKAIVAMLPDKKNISQHIKMQNYQDNLDIIPMQTGGVEIRVRSMESINLTGIEDKLGLLILLKYHYSDEFSGERIEKKYYYNWDSLSKYGTSLFYDDNTENIEKIDNYIEKNGLDI